MADPDKPTTLPDDPIEALRLAAEAVAHAAGTALNDRSILPPDWYAMYGEVSQILDSISNLATAAIDNMPVAMVRHAPYVDELGEPDSLEKVTGQWIVYTNEASFALGTAAGHWRMAHSRLGRIGVRAPEESGT
jgi:hypothetical protein